ncbi:LysR family transcriptional regulator [Eggerthella sinensis]|uniref:LysR family transcriptional regulator n=1 Tax=Eggerthella sinensis TaxID=242230 RepID=UPI001D068A90|nr:LysR family transcriptional regulator [Eggerthella sinensis]MCB7037050.1 LysR family transcriptional regulator [Eggerthella sinensis]
MDLQSLRAFCAVYEAGGISKASKGLYVSQQGLSKTIIKLEAELGKPLFTRSHQGVEPTAYARALYPKATKLAAILDSLEDEPEPLSGRVVLNVAAPAGFIMSVGLDFISDFESAHPGIELAIDECSDLRVAELLASGAIEVGFMAGPVDRARYRAELFIRHRHVVVVNNADPLSQRERLAFSDLDGKVVALMSRSYAPYGNIIGQFLKEGVAPKKLIETGEGYAGFHLAADNEAVCVSTDKHASIGARGDVSIVPVYDEYCSWDVYLVSNADEVLGDDAREFETYALAWVREHENRLFTWEHSIR